MCMWRPANSWRTHTCDSDILYFHFVQCVVEGAYVYDVRMHCGDCVRFSAALCHRIWWLREQEKRTLNRLSRSVCQHSPGTIETYTNRCPGEMRRWQQHQQQRNENTEDYIFDYIFKSSIIMVWGSGRWWECRRIAVVVNTTLIAEKESHLCDGDCVEVTIDFGSKDQEMFLENYILLICVY